VHYDGYINKSLVSDKLSQPYKMTGERIILYILFFVVVVVSFQTADKNTEVSQLNENKHSKNLNILLSL